jgi:DNA repair protein RecO (recombination protein O)
MNERVEGEAGYLLHSRPYRESSQLLDLFSENHGRLRLVAKATRQRSKKGAYSGLLPFCRYQLSWSGRGDLKTLIRAEPVEGGRFLRDGPLFTGLYLNELIYRLLHEHDPYPQLYRCYAQLLERLAAATERQPLDERWLRDFEMVLLDELGYGLVLDCEAISGAPLEPAGRYDYRADLGAVAGRSYSGSDLLAIASGQFDSAAQLGVAKRLLRTVIDFYLDGKPLNSRLLYRQHLDSSANRGQS